MTIQFAPLHTFKSREFAGSVYVAGMTYTLREGNEKLSVMLHRWREAELFRPNETMELFGEIFEAGKVSYALPDDMFMKVVESWVADGKAEFVDGYLVTFDVSTPPIGINAIGA